MKVWILGFLLVAGCSGVPSFWDDNESMLAAEVRFSVNRLDCEDPKPGVQSIKDDVDLLAIYSESKESQDLTRMVGLMKETVDDMYTRERISIGFCNLKKKILIKQSADIANAVMWRF